MEVLPTKLDGLLLLAPAVYGDDRGFFAETYRESVLADLGVHDTFVQDNHSRSARGVLRGLHFHIGKGTSKLVRCGRGRIWDVAVDLRPDSPTYRRWEGYELSDENMRQLYIPPGFAHGFVVLSEIADVLYKQSAYYSPDVERGIRFDDPDVGVAWPDGDDVLVSERDRSAPLLRDVEDTLPRV
jgi:dTDP-4-dehydrorhamnose 3,5-epimerase